MAYQPVSVQPNQGGDLITRMSYENVGPANYATKRDWRRVMDAEIRREGDSLFYANTGIAIGNQATPTTDPITLIHHARKANGKSALIVGTKTTLYRYFSFEDGNVYIASPLANQVYDAGVYLDLSGNWLVIATNFSSSGSRWEAHDVAGITVFNNGVDLPYYYDLNDLEANPLYELREQGIANVGTISEFNGSLMLGDITEIDSSTLASLMNGSVSSTTAAQTGTNVISASAAFTSDMVGKYIVWDSGETAKIISYGSGTSVFVDKWQTVSSGAFRVATLYGAYSNIGSRIQYKVVWSDTGDALNFASSVPGTINAGSTTLTLDYPIWSLEPGDDILITGAGASGAVLEATVLRYLNGPKTSAEISTPATTSVVSADVEKASALSSISGSIDLQDDGSPVLRMVELQGRLVVFKDTSIFVGRNTGSADLPFEFQKVYSGTKGIFWRWMVAKINGLFLLYAGRNGFYTFDLSSQAPREHNKLQLCHNLFYESATSTSLMDSCFASNNATTNEVWFVYPTSSSDKSICYDYEFDTCSTVGKSYTAANTIKRPVSGISTGPEQDWFVMGTSAGKILLYGATDMEVTSPIWTREGSNYDSTLKSGFVSFGDEFNEKDLRNYVLYFGQASNAGVQVKLYGARNVQETPTLLFNRAIAAPTYKNLIPTYFRKNYFQDEITVSGSALNAKLVRRVFEPASIDTRSAIRHP